MAAESGAGASIVAEDVGVSITRGEVLLAPVSFEVDAGTALAVVGPNGAGKTTLLRVLAGLVQPTTGTVRVAGVGVDERDRSFRSRVAALAGAPPLARNLTLREHVALVAASWGATVDDARRTADELLADFDLDRLAARFPHELSSGQVQLFSLALTLARPCEVLVVDEPEQRLDPDRLSLVAETLDDLGRKGTTVVVASHSTDLVEHVADHVLQVGSAELSG